MDSSLGSLFSMQSAFIDLQKYDDEFQTLLRLYRLPQDKKEYCENASLLWLKSKEEDENVEFAMKDDSEKIKESNDLRKEGNQLYTARNAQRNVLGACRLYNDAIFAALDCKSGDEVALGFANRAMSLQTFGYYEQAYDDCVCALRAGYPAAMRHKLITRQAYCSLQLGNVENLTNHLKELEGMPLNDGFTKQYKELREELIAINAANTKDNERSQTPYNELITRESQEM